MPGKQVAAGRPEQRAFSAGCRRGRPAGVGMTTRAMMCLQLAGERRMSASGATVTRPSRGWPSGALAWILLSTWGTSSRRHAASVPHAAFQAPFGCWISQCQVMAGPCPATGSAADRVRASTGTAAAVKEI